MLKLLYDPRTNGRPMRVVCFMSGSGTNVRKLIEYERRFEALNQTPPFKVVLIFTDDPDSNARTIAEEFSVPYIENNFEQFFKDKDRNDWKMRKLFDRMTYWLLHSSNADAIALCGYARIVTNPIIDNYLVVNVHPGDLSVTEYGRRKYVGLHHVPTKKAILAGEEFVHSTTHIVTEDLDAGPILMISKGLRVELLNGLTLDELKNNEELLDNIAKGYQNKLKEIGDWVIFPMTLHWIADGRFGLDEDGVVYLDGIEQKNGYRL